MSAPVVSKGEIITCENGHEICEVMEDVYPFQMNWHLCFGKWRQYEPTLGGRFPVCEVCGSEVFQFPSIWVRGEKRTIPEG